MTVITKFENIDYYFSDVIDEMKNDFLRKLIQKKYKGYLSQFDEILKKLRNNSNLDELIDKYKKKELTDYDRFYSLLSEIRAAYFLFCKSFPIRFFDCSQNNKAADIQTSIGDITSYIEVKRITRRKLEYEKINKELKKLGVKYFLTINLPQLGYSAENVAKRIDKKIKKMTVKSYPTDDIKFKYGSFKIIQPNPKNGAMLTQSLVIPYEKKVAEEMEDAEISLEQIFGGLQSDVEYGLEQLNASSTETDMCFILIDNHDVGNLNDIEMQEFLYSGIDISMAGNKEAPILQCVKYADDLGWNEFLVNMGFLPGKHKLDYSDKKGWFLYPKESKYLNGIFFLEGGTFKYNEERVFLNPFVKKQRNYCKLQDIFDYYRLND